MMEQSYLEGKIEWNERWRCCSKFNLDEISKSSTTLTAFSFATESNLSCHTPYFRFCLSLVMSRSDEWR